MSIRNRKGKAVKHQNEIRNLLRYFFQDVLEDDDITSRPMGNSGADIILSPKAQSIIPFYIECKRHEDSTWAGTYISSFEQTFINKFGLLIRKKNRSQNHFFGLTDEILSIHPRLFNNEKIIMHDNLLTFARDNSFKFRMYDKYIHFNETKFLEILTCLKRSSSL